MFAAFSFLDPEVVAVTLYINRFYPERSVHIATNRKKQLDDVKRSGVLFVVRILTGSELPKLYAVGELCKGLTTLKIYYI